MKIINLEQESKINKLVKDSVQYYRKFKNFGGMGTALKMKNGIYTGEIALVFGVYKKESIKSLSIKNILPDKIDDIPCDVITITKKFPLTNTGHVRPCRRGHSIGHPSVTAGTFGCVCSGGPNRLILSNNHVIANENNCKLGDPIYQPGVFDGGTAKDTVAYLYKYSPLFDGTNVDAAVAVEKSSDLISGFYAPNNGAGVSFNDSLTFNGRTSGDGANGGFVFSTDWDEIISYSIGDLLITDLILSSGGTGALQGGDSGSVDTSGGALGFAGGGGQSLWCKMLNVRNALGITIGDTGGAMLIANKQRSTSRFDR